MNTFKHETASLPLANMLKLRKIQSFKYCLNYKMNKLSQQLLRENILHIISSLYNIIIVVFLKLFLEVKDGSRLRELNKKAPQKRKKMTLKEVSEKTGLSISFLSQVERSLCSSTLLSLRKISEALGVSPSYFFPDTIRADKDMIRRAADRRVEQKTSFTYSDLSGNVPNPLFVPILVTLLPGDKKGTPFSHEGQEFIYVIEGTLTIIFDDIEYDLSPGDSIHIDSSRPHNWFNKTDKPVQFIFVSAAAPRD
ncbi:DNA-binding protein [Bacillus haynesii]|nr:DNA-binding protein [Bacillus haynesii]